MKKANADRSAIMEALEHAGGNRPGVARAVGDQTGIPEADVHGVATFYTLLAKPDVQVRVCQGLSCQLEGAARLLEDARLSGARVEAVSCLGQCDRAPAALDARSARPAPPAQPRPRRAGQIGQVAHQALGGRSVGGLHQDRPVVGGQHLGERHRLGRAP